MKKWPLRIIYYLTGFLMLSSIHCLIVGIVSGGSVETFLHSIIYLPVIILLSEGQKQTKYFWQYAIMIAGAVIITRLGIGVMTKGGFEQTLSTVLVMASAGIYFYARAKQSECLLEAPEYYYLGLYLIMWFLERQYPSELLEKFAVLGAGCYCLLCMYKTNLNEILQFIDLNGNLERFPEKRLLKSNLLMMGFQTVIVGLGMGFILSTGVDGLFSKLTEAMRKLVAWILTLLESEEQHVDSEISDGMAMIQEVEIAERSAFMEMLLKLFDILSWAIVIGLTLFVVYKVVKKFYQLYLEFDLNSVENGDEIEKIYTVQTKEEKKKIKKQRTENLRWDRSPNSRIRKAYKKRVLRAWKEIPGAAFSPTEIEQKIMMPEDKKEIFHRLYGQARYADVECSKEEAEQMMKI